MEKRKERVFIVGTNGFDSMKLKKNLEKNDFDVLISENLSLVADISKNTAIECIIIGREVKDREKIAKKIKKTDRDVSIILVCKTKKEIKTVTEKYPLLQYVEQPISYATLAKTYNKSKDVIQVERLYNFGRFTFNSLSRVLTLTNEQSGKEKTRRLTKKEAYLLCYLVKNIGKLVPREKLLNHIWGKNDFRTSRSMDVYIAKLRSYLKPDEKVSIKNEHSLGFKLVVEQ
ncbi:MAG: winged helix-turn-helix transcriptional regulator [Bacteroidales bacterium]|nr:winged helix-turn-helix transcriptional regulator [Bacteroidales bacterium]MBQ9313012.1 winged helix-turn-helix transcriptional regulator [Bacteroidales bacterium]